jgi:hypothetical protein
MSESARCTADLLNSGWNLISVPVDPDDPKVESVFAALEKAGNDLAHAVFSYDGTGYVVYPEELALIRKGDGYWLRLDYPVSFTVMGESAMGDVSMGLREGWSLIGCPFDEPVAWADCSVSDGTTTKSVALAASDGWIQAVGYYYEQELGYRLLKHDGTGHDDSLRPWCGYWVRAFRPGLILTIPSP